MLFLLLSCDPAPSEVTGEPAEVGAGLFRGGCPVAGRSAARMLVSAAERPWGDEALAGPGDALLLNTHAAFVIQGVGDPDTYYHYGGAPIDAVAVDGCDQAGPEILEELGFVVGQLSLTDFGSSSLRQLRGTEIEVVSDGADGGPAVVEVRAVDDRFWLVELTLVRDAYNAGEASPLAPLFGLELLIRYTLDPDSPVLQIEVELGGAPNTDGFLVGAAVFPSDELQVHAFAADSLNIGGFDLTLGVPWLSMAGAEGSQAVAMPGANMAYTEVAGVRALLDANQSLVPLQVYGAESPPVVPFLLAVGPGDGGSASGALEAYHVDPLGPGVPATWGRLDGAVVDAVGPVGGVTVEVQAPGIDGEWTLLERLVTDTTGRFSANTLMMSGTRLVGYVDGRDPSDPVELVAGQQGWLELGPPGSLRVEVSDTAGNLLPVRVELEREDGEQLVDYPLPGERVAVPPGRWKLWVSRGYEYEILATEVVIPEGGEAVVTETLRQVLDTRGWASVDTHVHAEASSDSATLAGRRFRTAAASGLDVMVSTDHEAIVDMSPTLLELGLDRWMSYGLGSEVTATVPEHVNAWPFPATDDARGSTPVWYQLGFPDIYAAIRERGARVIQLNHSRVNGECGILCVADWDRLTDPPTVSDPEALGMLPGTVLWSWDFDSFEVMNSNRSPLLDEDDPRHSGALIDWLGFHNLGYRVTGVAVTDVHGEDIPGQPRVFARVPDDAPGEASADDVAEAELGGHAVISAGAWLRVDIDGAGPGDLAPANGVTPNLNLEITALPEVDVTEAYILVNCDLWAIVEAEAPAAVVKLSQSLPLELDGDAYVVVLAFGDQPMPRGLKDYLPQDVPRAISNPIFVDTDGDGLWTPPGAKSCATGLRVGGRSLPDSN